MKKVSLLAIALSLGTAASAEMSSTAITGGCPQAFKGFHLGGNLGYGVGVDKVRTSATNDETTPSSHFSRRYHVGIRGFDGGIGTGYTHRFCNWAVGLNFDANWANSDGKITDRISSRLKNSLQLYTRVGYVLHEQIMPFVGIGWDNSRWRNRVREELEDAQGRDVTFTSSKTRHFNALLWKAGFDFLLTRHVVAGAEWTGTNAGRKSFKFGPANDRQHASFRPQYNTFKATLKLVY